jgi:hypothetical protein
MNRTIKEKKVEPLTNANSQGKRKGNQNSPSKTMKKQPHDQNKMPMTASNAVPGK